MSFNQDQMVQLISDLKSIAVNNPAKITELFKVSPQLSYLIVQAMLSLKLIDDNTILSLVDRTEQQQQQAQQISPQPQAQANKQLNNQHNQEISRQPPQHSRSPNKPQQQQQLQPQQQPQQQQQQQQPPQQPQPTADSQQIELIRQVMQLTDEQIAALPADHRNTLNALRERVLRGEIRI